MPAEDSHNRWLGQDGLACHNGHYRAGAQRPMTASRARGPWCLSGDGTRSRILLGAGLVVGLLVALLECRARARRRREPLVVSVEIGADCVVSILGGRT